MRFAAKVGIWLAVFAVVLAYRFPYQYVFLRLIDEAQRSTNAQITWSELEANILGAKLQDLEVTMPSGFSFQADRATIRPSFSGIVAKCEQTSTEGSCTAQLGRSGLEFQAEKLQVNTGSDDLGTVAMSGNLTYALTDKNLSGEIHLLIPELRGILPMPLKGLEIGDTLSTETAKGDTKSSILKNSLKLFGEGIDGQGQLDLTTTEGASSPALSGELTVTTKGFGTHTIDVGGTWARPKWNLAGAKK